jgi:L-methionine (R)-S-oxide reductase
VLQDVVDILHDSFEKYSWVGIYLVRGDSLVLGPWKGTQATEHTTIPIGRGVCGAAAKTGKTEVVDDVSKDKRYLSCFLSTKSEIVVPIKKKNVVIGEIDIDSDEPSAFNKNDEMFLERIAEHLSKSMK